MNRKLLRIDMKNLPIYIALIPFLYPRGFAEYFSGYSMFFTIWMYVALLWSALYFVYSLTRHFQKYNNTIFFMFLYFIVMITITVIKMQGIGNGLQKMFVAPALCIVCYIFIGNNAKRFINCLSNVLIVLFTLNITLFNPLLWTSYFGAMELHIVFLGHVQVVSQIGLLGVIASYILKRLDIKMRLKSNILFGLAIINMICSMTAASLLSLGILFVGIVYIYLSKNKTILLLDSRKYFWIYVVSNILMFILFVFQGRHISILGVTMNGRTLIWESAIKKWQEQKLFGYGVHGVLLQTFWSSWVGEGLGMNYAHNQIMQGLLDGGIILVIAFSLMIIAYIKRIKRVQDIKFRAMLNLWLIIMFFIMSFESSMEYFYFYIGLSIFLYAPEIEKGFRHKGDV